MAMIPVGPAVVIVMVAVVPIVPGGIARRVGQSGTRRRKNRQKSQGQRGFVASFQDTTPHCEPHRLRLICCLTLCPVISFVQARQGLHVSGQSLLPGCPDGCFPPAGAGALAGGAGGASGRACFCVGALFMPCFLWSRMGAASECFPVILWR